MDDKDFDNIFGDKLKEQKGFPFSEEKWKVLDVKKFNFNLKCCVTR